MPDKDGTPTPAEVAPDVIEGTDMHEHIDAPVHVPHVLYPSVGEPIEPEPFVVQPPARPLDERI